MTRIAFVFPGQGSQSVGMGQALAAASPAAAAVFAEADAALGEPISRLAFEGPAEELDLTVNAQPALLATSIAYLAALRERWAHLGHRRPRSRAFCAGHSMGQYSALVAAGVVPLDVALRLVRERGRQMQRSGAGREGRMAAIIGLDDSRLPELVVAAGLHGIFGVANRNSPGQVVVSGERAAVEAALVDREGARRPPRDRAPRERRRPLAAHGRRRRRHARRAGRTSPFADPHPPLLANADGRARSRPAEACRAELVDHLTTGVDWVAGVERMVAEGVDTFIEVGPGRVLTGLIKRIAPDADAIADRRSGRARSTRRAIPRPEPQRQLRLTPPTPTGEPNLVRTPDYNRRVAVTGLGVISPVGNDEQTAWDNLHPRPERPRRDHPLRREPLRGQDGRRGQGLRPARVARSPRRSGGPRSASTTASPPPSRPSPTRASRSTTRTATRSASCSAPAPAASSS